MGWLAAKMTKVKYTQTELDTMVSMIVIGPGNFYWNIRKN